MRKGFCVPAPFWVRTLGSVWEDGACALGAWVDGRRPAGTWEYGVAGAFPCGSAERCLIADSSVLSRNNSRINARCDSIVLPCSTISMVIRAYEIRKRTVNRGSHPFLLAFFTGAGTISKAGVLAVSTVANNVVKWHPGSSPQLAGYRERCIPSANDQISSNLLIVNDLYFPWWPVRTLWSATRCTF